MKTLSACLASVVLLFPVLFSKAQTPTTMNPKHIEVTGVAELEIVPDELYFSINLREYFQDEKNQKNKVTIDLLEKQLVEAVKAAGLPKEDLRIGSLGGYKQWFGRKKPQLFLESKQYILKVSNLNKIDGILSKVEERGVEYAGIQRVDHSRKEELRKEIKIKALQAAKEKATYLVESIGEKLDGVLEIRELEDNFYYPQPLMMKAQANMRMEAMADAAPAPDSDLEYQKIKISYRMQANFKIK